MSRTIPDYWPKVLESPEMLPPVAILRQQATLLGEKTQNLVVAEVCHKTLTTQEKFHYDFDLVAPALDNYRHRLFFIRHGLGFYPLELHAKSMSTVNNEEEFLQNLQKLLSSEETKRVINALLAQSRA